MTDDRSTFGPAQHAENLLRWMELGVVRVVAWREGVKGLPDWLRDEYREIGAPMIALDVSWNFPQPIENLAIDADGIRGGFSFKNTVHHIDIPWSVVFSYTMPAGAESRRGLVLHCELPTEAEPEPKRPVPTRPTLKLV